MCEMCLGAELMAQLDSAAMQGTVICTEDPFEVEWHCRAALSMRPEAIGLDSEWRADDGTNLSLTALLQVGMPACQLEATLPYLYSRNLALLLIYHEQCLSNGEVMIAIDAVQPLLSPSSVNACH